MTHFIKECPICGELMVETLVNVKIEEDLKVCQAEAIPALMCVNKNCNNREKYFAPFSMNLLKMKCPEINKF